MESSMELREYGRILKKRLWLIAVCVIIACLTTAIISFYFMKPVYQASTKLIVNKSNPDASVMQQVSLQEVNVNILLISTYKEIIKTTAIMDQVVEMHPEFNLTAEELTQKIKVSSVNNTQVMTLSVEDYSYQNAVNLVNAVSNVFKDSIPNIMKVDNVEILNEAKLMEHPAPIKPNPILNVVISFMVALMFSVGVAFLLEYLDDTVKTESDVANIMGIPALAAIPVIRDQDLAPRKEKSVKQKVGEAPYAQAANR
jgi:capsular polysaccharide biosynthesis protein